MLRTDELKDVEIIKSVIGKNNELIITRMGGMTNRTYRVKVSNEEIVVRLPGEGTEELINRKNEKISTQLACQLGIDSQLYMFDELSGIKVSKYIMNAETMTKQRLQEDVNLVKVAKVLGVLHSCGKDTGVSFDVIEMAKRYENIIQEGKGSFYEGYDEIKKRIELIKKEYLSSINKVPCHNDPLCENWILQLDSKMYLIDWEYAGMNDPMWDLADVALEAELNNEQERLLLKSYFSHEPGEKEWKAFHINKVLIDYLWSLWGKARAIYDGEVMEEYAAIRYERMKNSMNTCLQYFIV